MRQERTTRSRASVALSARLKQLGLTHAAAAEAIGKKPSTVSMWCAGLRSPKNSPKDPTQNRIADEFGIPTEWWGQPAEERREQGAAA